MARPPSTAITDPASVLAPGGVIGERYAIVSQLDRGGMGMVLIAEHVELGRRVALKVLQSNVGDDATMRKRFEREARTLAAMSHPNIVALNDYGIWQGMPYLVMELLEGRTLRDLLDHERALPLERAIDIATQLLRALAYAHAQGVIHRDLKPGNVFLQALPDHVDHVKLLDFGFAKFVNTPAGPPASAVSADGIAVGTPAYMAPEQAGGVVDHRADVYAAGVLLFEMITGRRPFEGEPIDMMRRRLTEDAPEIAAVRHDLDVAPELELAVARALARRIQDRWASAEEMSAALAKVRSNALMPRPAGVLPRTRSTIPPPPRSSDEPSVEVLDSLDFEPASAGARPNAVVPPRERASARGAGAVSTLLVLSVLGAGLGYVVWRLPSGASDPRATLAPASTEPGVEPAIISPPETAEEQATGAPTPEGAPAIGAPTPEAPPEIADPTPEAAPAIAEEPIAAHPVGGGAIGEATDPWSADVPPELAALRARIESPSVTLAPIDIQRVGSYSRHHPGDARALLLLGHGAVRMRWMTEALTRYREAFDLDPASRGDPRLLENLVVLARSPAVGDTAAELLAAIYGAGAIPAIDRALAAPELDRGAASRLREARALAAR